jgi:hypothetical protein
MTRQQANDPLFGRLISDTGQNHKLIIAFATLVCGALLVFCSNRLAYGYVVGPTGAVIGLAGFFYAPLSVRCPRCRFRFVWDAMRWHSVSTWGDVLRVSRCPRCDFQPDKR